MNIVYSFFRRMKEPQPMLVVLGRPANISHCRTVPTGRVLFAGPLLSSTHTPGFVSLQTSARAPMAADTATTAAETARRDPPATLPFVHSDCEPFLMFFRHLEKRRDE